MTIINDFSSVITGNIFVALFASFFAGLVSAFTPCVLSAIPLVIGYVGGYALGDKRKAFLYSLSFALGITITLIIIGIVTSLVGHMFIIIGSWKYLILGSLLLLVGLEMLHIVAIIPQRTNIKSSKKGALGAFLLGLLGGVISSTCSIPILLMILALVLEQGQIIYGVLLLLFYSLGHSILIIIAGSSVNIADKLIKSNKTKVLGEVLKSSIGVLVILFALYLFYLGF